ncbi:1,6-anhydro-N-acetylmuramyl-L-alanine amidase AmpD [Gayadomonas joobiniege]|uniref:1,6-anhydro-N-acetylmuramyl-L-alanine amidase AmpD n=1 Tax=Gayadomonas joobiniege TaxID=1234606 RepID=UPI00036B5381|nr:1,6-anhydro-N-acetylmuramyl-L-alanine amidase AmpD [Gayadomonas joobiniege]
MNTPVNENFIKDDVLPFAKYIPSPHFNERPANTLIDLLVVHCISLPAGQFNTPHVNDLFLGQLNCQAHPSFVDLADLRVSAHLVIWRDGLITQYVPFSKRAWHAGLSAFDGRSGCNDFSVGIELEGCDNLSYTENQYHSLVKATAWLRQKYPNITSDKIVGHSDIAPGRKTDPGPAFDWQKFKTLLEAENDNTQFDDSGSFRTTT